MLKRHDGTPIPEDDVRKFRQFVDSHRWIFAKTYAAFCPHEYTLQRESNWEDFAEFFEFIWNNGFDAFYGKKLMQRYFIDYERGWYYFVSYNDVDENGKAQKTATLINRASLKQWELVEEESLFGTTYRWKRLPKERRQPVN